MFRFWKSRKTHTRRKERQWLELDFGDPVTIQLARGLAGAPALQPVPVATRNMRSAARQLHQRLRSA